uniref:Uncharacterized protein n=1 Tax=Sphaerodactylus townsendi TaxID=933632 RepID=A0ACB8G5S4_9SAUR
MSCGDPFQLCYSMMHITFGNYLSLFKIKGFCDARIRQTKIITTCILLPSWIWKPTSNLAWRQMIASNGQNLPEQCGSERMGMWFSPAMAGLVGAGLLAGAMSSYQKLNQPPCMEDGRTGRGRILVSSPYEDLPPLVCLLTFSLPSVILVN